MDNKNKELSRVELHNKKNRKNNPDSTKIFTLPFILVILLFLLPVAYLLMNNLGNGSAQSTQTGGNNKAGQTIPVQNDEPKQNEPNDKDEKNVANNNEQEDDENKDDEEKKKQEELDKQEEEKTKEAEAKKKQEAEDKRKQEEAEQKKQEEAERLEKEEKEKEQQQSKTHTVQKGETLYRIAMNYYNDPSGVAKIQAANGLSGTDISVGQTLIIP